MSRAAVMVEACVVLRFDEGPVPRPARRFAPTPFDRCGVNAWDGVGPHIEDYIKAKREPYEAICATLRSAA